jgi:hypothetical protein
VDVYKVCSNKSSRVKIYTAPGVIVFSLFVYVGLNYLPLIRLTTVFNQISWKLVNKVEMMISTASLNMDHLWSKTRSHSLNTCIGKHFLHSRGYCSRQNILDDGYNDFQVKFEYWSLVFRN